MSMQDDQPVERNWGPKGGSKWGLEGWFKAIFRYRGSTRCAGYIRRNKREEQGNRLFRNIWNADERVYARR